MVLLHDIMDAADLARAIADGYVTNRLNDSGTLAILNYTPKAQYDNHWTDVTKACRGLIYDTETSEVVARPFEKFFNWDQGAVKYPPPGPVLRMPKMDGSLGILYTEVDPQKFDSSVTSRYKIATRGSMNSEQAVWATRKFNDMLYITGEAMDFFPAVGKTYLFEIIYPENRIVVNYGDQERLTLLDVIDNETGFSDTSEFEACDWPDKVERVLLPGFDSGQVVDIPPGEEGFVYLWPVRNFRTKMKAAEYIELHRIIFNLTPKNIWRAMVAGKSLEEIKEPFPDEFYDEINGIWANLEAAVMLISDKVFTEYNSIDPTLDRKSFASAVKKRPRQIQGMLFALKDGKDIRESILRMVEPKGDKPRLEEE